MGRDSRWLNFMYLLIECIKEQLSGWKSMNLSLGDFLVLLKFFMSSLPVYFLSFFKAPTCIITSIDYIFFLGYEDVKNTPWIK